MDVLIAKTGYSFLDVWTIAHLSFWLFMGSNVWVLNRERDQILHRWLLAVSLGMALLWEVFERFAEKQWPTVWLSPESWWNAWLSDPLTCVVGVLGMVWLLNKAIPEKKP